MTEWVFWIFLTIGSIALVVDSWKTYREVNRRSRSIKESCDRSMEIMRDWPK